jgi:DNA (cytosine-5)-methyltransferase 1
MNLLDLFSGIGGFSLGLERAGFQTVAFCEIDPWCRRVLAKHWPGVPCYDDVRQLDAARLRADGIDSIDAICGGFPCQDISSAGNKAGLAGARSGLWFEFHRLIGELRPRYVIVENVADLLHRGLGDVLGGLAAIGYDAEWHCLPAAAVGAPHRRDRVWIVAYPNADGWRCEVERLPQHADEQGQLRSQSDRLRAPGSGARPAAADADSGGRQYSGTWAEHVDVGQVRAAGLRQWGVEPELGRVVDGFPGRVDRIRALGNAVVPQIPELIGRVLLQGAAA